MMIDAETLKTTAGIDDEPMELYKWLKTRHGYFISPYTARGRTHSHSDRSWQEQITLMQPYKAYFISAGAMSVHPFNPDWYVWRKRFGAGSR